MSGRSCRHRSSCSATPTRCCVSGLPEFARQASQAGVDGVLALDLPIEEAGEFQATMSGAGIDTIFLLSPTTTDARIKKAAALGEGFLYGISRLGVTGARAQVSADAETLVRRIRAVTVAADRARLRHFAARARGRGRRLCRRGGRRQRPRVGDCGGARVAAAGRARGDVRAVAPERVPAAGAARVNVEKCKVGSCKVCRRLTICGATSIAWTKCWCGC